jgi:hypothetical protein
MQNERAEHNPSQVNEEVERWLAIRREAASRIVTATAEVTFMWGNVVDPYGIYSDVPVEFCGRNYFARSPGRVWISFDDVANLVT